MRVGIDITDIDRFKGKALDVFNKVELEYANSFASPEIHIAGFWTAKEAFLKAIGTGIQSLKLGDIYVDHEKNGKPYLVIPQELKTQYKIEEMSLSISHTKATAISICILN